ncbi:O-methyltransferase [Micromonospora sp. NPDC007271]|uniref:O-methyltransferase n=1 Tax=Micromonospora sp. NPDC007271 TaxID=3154587 RepID=UPI00340E1EE0
MGNRVPITVPGIEEYAQAHTTADPDHLLGLAAETRESCDRPVMMVGPVEARFLQFFLYAQQPRRVLEIGTFTGYSALSMAEALPDGGHIDTCELSEKHAEIARRHIAASKYAYSVTVHVGPALETIRRLPGPYDFILLDADQAHFPDYLDPLLDRLSDGGFLAVDNVLWDGAVLDEADQQDSTRGVRLLNDTVASRPDLTCVMLTIRDGIMLIRRNRGGV